MKIHIKTALYEYERVYDASILRIFGFVIYRRVGRVSNLLGVTRVRSDFTGA